MSRRADLTVRGAGVLGLSVAWEALRRGLRARVVDPGGPGAGASGGVVGALSPLPPDGWDEGRALQLEALMMAPAWWAGAAAAGGADPGYARTGRLMPLPDEAAVARARRRGAEAARRGWAWEVVEAGGPLAPLSPTGLLARDALAARVDPRRAVAALVAAIRARGGEVVAEAPEEGIVVEATGAAGLVARGLGGGVKGQAARLRLPGVEREPQAYAGGLYVVPHADGTVAVGSTSEAEWVSEGPDGLLDDVVARARALVPALAAAPVLERWAGLRPRARGGRMVLGEAAPGRWVANGAFRTGFALAPLAARLLLDALEGRGAVPASWRPPP